MIKIYQKAITLILLFFVSMMGFSQQFKRCSTQEYIENQFRIHPGLRIQYETNERNLGEAITANLDLQVQSRTAFAAPVTIPVVFHVVLTAAQQFTVTDEMIRSQLNVLNQDFTGRNSDSANVPAEFQLVRGHSQVSFCLAQRTPAGTATTGINRVVSTLKSGGTGVTDDPIKYTAEGGADAWDPTKYINIWLCNFDNATLLGYASFPIGTPEYGGDSLSNQGVVVLAQTIPGGTAAPYNKGRTLTHELGHYFWLRHVNGDEPCGNDFPNTPGIDDTPLQSSLSGGCPGQAPVVNSQASGCSSSPNPPGRMFQNFMDYTDDGCMTMFTNGQNLRSEMAINMFRPGLLKSDGCLPPSGFKFSTLSTLNYTCGSLASPSTSLTTTNSDGFATPIVLSYNSIPAGPLITFTPNTPSPGNSATVSIANAASLPFGTYTITITGTAGTAVQTTTLVFNISTGLVLAFTLIPASKSICAGTAVSFSSAVTGAANYQWQVSTLADPAFTNITGATNASYTIPIPGSFMNENQYRVLARGQCGSAISDAATLVVNLNPEIKLTSAGYTSLTPYKHTELISTITPTAPYKYKWYKNGVLIPSITSSNLPITVDGFGEYYVVATNELTSCFGTSNIVTVKDSVDNSTLFVYPNPNRGSFQVRFYNHGTTNIDRMVMVYDGKGTRVFSQKYSVAGPYGKMDVNLGKITGAGTYFIDVRDNAGKRIASSQVIIMQ